MTLKKRNIKVLCTLGPASLNRGTIERLQQRGVDLFRINLSHTPVEKIAETIEIIQSYSNVAVCLDTEGAQARTGLMADQVVVSEAQRVRLTPDVVQGTETIVRLTPRSVFGELQPNHLVGLDFDGVILLVLRVDAEGAETVVLNGGKIGSNKAVQITPQPQLPALSDKDREAVTIGHRYGIKHYALSFTNSAQDVHALRELVGENATIISKIESKRGVLNLNEILHAADEILIDRGDLSREVPLENIPLLQKAIIRKANVARVPVNVATNLLESMISNRKPTRAELNDIINTLLDGADGLVLAAETAIGKYPVGTVDMVLHMIERFRLSAEGYRIEDLLDSGTSLLARSRETRFSPDRRGVKVGHGAANITRLPAIEVDIETAVDIEQITSGVYSPVRGFMTQVELESVLDNYRLPSGDVWTMPIVLQGRSQEFAAFHPGQSVRLVDPRTGHSKAILHLEDKFEIDRDNVALRWFGTSDRVHPGVNRLMNRGLTFLGGSLEGLDSASCRQTPYELTPEQTRLIFDLKGWTKVVAFHSQNVPHLAHEHLITHAKDRCHADGVLIHPAIGPSPGDFAARAIIGAYEQLIRSVFSDALLAGFCTYNRHCGARETVFNALCRRNFGCTHFAIGPDDECTDGQQGNQQRRELFEFLGDIGITPVFFDTVYFSETEGITVEGTNSGSGLKEISGTRIRELLTNNNSVPGWCMRSEVSDWLLEERLAGRAIFVGDQGFSPPVVQSF